MQFRGETGAQSSIMPLLVAFMKIDQRPNWSFIGPHRSSERPNPAVGQTALPGTIWSGMTESNSSPLDRTLLQPVDWGECLAAHEVWLRKVIFARTGELQAVEEVFQHVALAALEQRSPLVNAEKVAPWLHRLAVVWSARYRRKLGRGRRALAAAGELQQSRTSGQPADLLSWLVAKERREQIQAALAEIPGRDAEVLVLKYGERWSYRQIAERLGINEKAVDMRLVRARHRLREVLRYMGIDGSDL